MSSPLPPNVIPPSATHVVVHTAPGNYRGPAKACWAILLIACALSAIPVLGFAAWFISSPLLLTCFILAIIVLARGGLLQGLLLLLFTLVIAPIFIVCAPFIASLIGLAGAGAALDNYHPTPQPQPQVVRLPPAPPVARPMDVQSHSDFQNVPNARSFAGATQVPAAPGNQTAGVDKSLSQASSTENIAPSHPPASVQIGTANAIPAQPQAHPQVDSVAIASPDQTTGHDLVNGNTPPPVTAAPPPTTPSPGIQSAPDGGTLLFQRVIEPGAWSENIVFPSTYRNWRLTSTSPVKVSVDGSEHLLGENFSIPGGSTVRVRSVSNQRVAFGLRIFMRAPSDVELRAPVPYPPLTQGVPTVPLVGPSAYEVAEKYRKGDGVSRDLPRAASLYQQAADTGDARAQAMLGTFYLNGIGVPKDQGRGVQLLRQSAQQGNADGQSRLAGAYRSGTGVSVDKAEARRLYGAALANGNSFSRLPLADMYFKGEGGPKDVAKGISLLRQGMDQHDLNAQAVLGEKYFLGTEVPGNRNLALRLLGQAARQGNAIARNFLKSHGIDWQQLR